MLQNPIVVALDFDNRFKALQLVDKLDPALCRVKIGKEMFTLFGPELVRDIQHRGFDLFLDLKFHDIPNTVAKAVAAAADLGVWMVNVHASGGMAMMDAARKALLPFGDNAPLLIAVTVLTSMSSQELQQIGVMGDTATQVQRLAALAFQAGLDGVVCSAQEATLLKATHGEDFRLVTPGIRPAGSAVDDQKRIMTPAQALQAGADYLVIGRPITQAADPLAALEAVYQSIQ